MDELYELAGQVGSVLKQQGWMLATAESCTGGWVGEAVTAIAGSSHWYDRGFITYTNAAKTAMLDVRADTLAQWGAVSEATVREMAAGALAHSDAAISVAISGIAGPGGGSIEKPVGTVCLAWATRSGLTVARTCHFNGDRTEVRRQAVVTALRGVLQLASPGAESML